MSGSRENYLRHVKLLTPTSVSVRSTGLRIITGCRDSRSGMHGLKITRSPEAGNYFGGAHARLRVFM